MQKENFYTQTRFEPKLFYIKKCVNGNKSELAKNSIKYKLDRGWRMSEKNKTAAHQ